jgi:hypothetical protein
MIEALFATTWHLRLFTADMNLHSVDEAALAQSQYVFCIDGTDSTANRSTLTLVTSQVICIPPGAVRPCPGRKLAVVNGGAHLSHRNWHSNG